MLEVATSDLVVGPTRLLFPRSAGGVGEAADFPFSLLGLGDIAIPGRCCRGNIVDVSSRVCDAVDSHAGGCTVCPAAGSGTSVVLHVTPANIMLRTGHACVRAFISCTDRQQCS